MIVSSVAPPGHVPYAVNFNNYASGAWPASFALDYSGAGTGYLNIAGSPSVATWQVNSATQDRQVLARFTGNLAGYSGSPANLAPDTVTDYQELYAQLSGLGGLGNNMMAINGACLRMNAAMDTFVIGQMMWDVQASSFAYQLLASVGGVVTILDTVDVSLSSSFSALDNGVTLKAGVCGNPWRFQGITGESVLLDYTDTAHVSQMGPGCRGWGFYSTTANMGSYAPSNAVLVGCWDNIYDAIMRPDTEQFGWDFAQSTQFDWTAGTAAQSYTPPGWFTYAKDNVYLVGLSGGASGGAYSGAAGMPGSPGLYTGALLSAPASSDFPLSMNVGAPSAGVSSGGGNAGSSTYIDTATGSLVLNSVGGAGGAAGGGASYVGEGRSPGNFVYEGITYLGGGFSDAAGNGQGAGAGGAGASASGGTSGEGSGGKVWVTAVKMP